MTNLEAALHYFRKHNLCVIPWKNIMKEGDKKPSKTPIIKWTDYQKKMCTEQEIVEWWTKWPDAEVGIVTGTVSDMVVFDTDDEAADQYFQSMLPDSFSCPVASTPGGGKHYCFKSPAGKVLRNAAKINGYKLDFRGDGGFVGCPPSTNGNGKCYAYLPGLSLDDIELPEMPCVLLELLNNSMHALSSLCIKGGTRGNEINADVKMFEDGRRDNDLFHIAHLIALGGGSEEEALQVLVNIAKSWGEEHKIDWISSKVKSAFERKAQRQTNISEEVRRYILLTNGYFCVRDCYNELILLQNVKPVTNCYNVKLAIRQEVYRLKERGDIKADPRRDGYYTRVDDKCEDMDILNVSIKNHPLKLPLDLRKYVKIMPKNIIVLAGAKSAGKTAMNLNIAWLNRNYPEGVYYYNSEMAKEELRIRIDSFGQDYPLQEWTKIHFKERTTNFADVIKQTPDAIHIVDFLEIYDNFYEVGLLIRDIYDALRGGVAIVSIQKNAGVSLGLGGARSIEKARLYLTMDYGKITITDAKLFEIRGINPRGWQLDYKLHDGCKYQSDPRGWYDPNERMPKGIL